MTHSGCDGDDSTVCLQVDWYDSADETFERSLFEGRSCARQESILEAKMKVTSTTAIPPPPERSVDGLGPGPTLMIRVQTDARVNGSDRYPEVILFSP